MRWTAHLEGGPRRVNHAAVCIDDKIYSFGGYCSTDDYKDWEPIPVYVLYTSTLRWAVVNYKKNDVVPFQRYGHSTVAYGHKVYMWGGRNNAVPCETLSCFDTDTLEWSNPNATGMVPFAKDGHSACIVRNNMYIFGGFDYMTDQYSQEIHCLNLDTFKWSIINATGSPPSYRDFHTSVSHGDKIYVFGGRGDLNGPYNSLEEIYCPQVYCLNVDEEKWVSLNPSGTWPEGRRSHSAWVHEDDMYIFGGYNGMTRCHFNDLYKYSIKHNHWTLLTPNGRPPCKRRRQACLMYENKVYLFGGTSPHPKASQMQGLIDDDDDDLEKLIDNSDLHVLDFQPTLRTLSMVAVYDYELEHSDLPKHIVMDIKNMTTPNRISRPTNKAG